MKHLLIILLILLCLSVMGQTYNIRGDVQVTKNGNTFYMKPRSNEIFFQSDKDFLFDTTYVKIKGKLQSISDSVFSITDSAQNTIFYVTTDKSANVLGKFYIDSVLNIGDGTVSNNTGKINVSHSFSTDNYKYYGLNLSFTRNAATGANQGFSGIKGNFRVNGGTIGINYGLYSLLTLETGISDNSYGGFVGISNATNHNGDLYGLKINTNHSSGLINGNMYGCYLYSNKAGNVRDTSSALYIYERNHNYGIFQNGTDNN